MLPERLKMKRMPSFRKLLLLSSALALLAPGPLHAADQAEIARGQTVKIDAFGQCRNLTNNGADPVMVPYATAKEWSDGENAFLYEPRENVAVANCASGWTNAAATYVTSFYCPNTHSRQFCGQMYSKAWASDNGELIFAFANNDSGNSTPITSVMRNDSGTVTQIADQSGTKWDQPTAGLAVSPDGSHFVQWDRRPTSSGASPKVALYSFDGTTTSLVAQAKLSGPGAYVSPAITDDGKFVAADGVIFAPVAGVLTPVTVTGQQIHVGAKNTSAIVDTEWNEVNKAFYEFSASNGLFETKRMPDDSWVRTKIANPRSDGSTVMGLTVARDGNVLAYSSVTNWRDKSNWIHIMRRDASGAWMETGKANHAVDGINTLAHYYYRLSANDGRFLLWPDKSGQVLFFDTAQIEQGKFVVAGAIKPQTTGSVKKQEYVGFKADTLPSGLMLIRHWPYNSNRGIIEVWKTQ